VTSDYDSCFEIETETEIEGVVISEAVRGVAVGGVEAVRRGECEYNDTDSGVIENSTGLFIGTDLEVSFLIKSTFFYSYILRVLNNLVCVFIYNIIYSGTSE